MSLYLQGKHSGGIRQKHGVRFALEVDPAEITYNIKTPEKGIEDYVLSYEHEAPVVSREDGVEQCIE